MSEPWEFIQRVVAWPGPSDPGYVNLHFLPPPDPQQPNKKGGMRGRAFRELGEFMSFAQWCTANPLAVAHTYFCLSTQAHPGKAFHGKLTASRSANFALKLKSLWLDIDVGPTKGYHTLGAAIDAVAAFVASAQLPDPSALVFSGSGLHVYWISDRPLSVVEWRPYAEGLKAEAIKHGLKCDAGLTTDCARVLRVPGTTNGKTTPARVVELKHLGQDYDFGSTLGGLAQAGAVAAASVTAPVTKAIPAFDLSAFAGKRPASAFAALDASADKLSDGINVHDDRPLNPDQIVLKCRHLQDACLTHGAAYPQGLWMLDVLASTFWENGRTWAHYMSRGYNAYSPAETNAMYDRKEADKARGMGWPSCKAFENEGAKECPTCPFHNKIKSPLNLAERLQPPTVAINTPPPPPADMVLPDGFTVDQDTGWICKIVEKKGSNGFYENFLAPLFACKLRNFEATTGDGDHHGLGFQCNVDMDNWVDVFIPDEIISSYAELLRALRRQRVKPHWDHKLLLEGFMTALLAKMDAIKYRLNAVPYGWVVEGGKRVGFAYGGKVARKDGAMTNAGIPDIRIERQYKPVGQPEPWLELMKIITDQKHPALEALVALSFAAPLMWVPGLYNCVLCAYSNAAGAHKTTSICAGLAVWGNPQLTKETPFSTARGFMHKLGELRNLPIYMDEVNSVQHMSRVQEYISMVTEGVGGTRLNSDVQFRDKESWQSLVGVGANVSLWDEMLKKSKSTDAQLQRVFEIEVDKRSGGGDPLAIQRLVESLNYNYGHMGMRFAQYLAKNVDHVDKFTKTICEGFIADVEMQEQERYRAAIAGTMVAGAALANGLGATFNVDLLYDYLKAEFLKQRNRIMKVTTVTGTREKVLDVLGHFQGWAAGHVVWTDIMPAKGRPAPTVTLSGPERTDTAIWMRCATNKREIAIVETEWDRFMQEFEYPMATISAGLENFLGAKRTRLTINAGTRYSGGRSPVIVIPVPDAAEEALIELLFRHTPDSQRPGPVGPNNTPPSPSLGLTGATMAGLIEQAASTGAADISQQTG